MPDSTATRIAIIGAGPLGIAAGHELLKQGITDFVIFEREAKAGGTWHIHSYPGLACDVWAHSYTFSYAPNPSWSANYVNQPEIEAYLQRCVAEFGLEPYIRYNTKITSARYQNDGNWLLTTADGKQQTVNVIINAMGNQHTPIMPKVDSIERFKGASWHSTHWNHQVDLTGKRVAIVGSAAAAVQIVPEVAAKAGHLYVLQRTPNWIMPRNKRVYSPLMLALMKHVPGFAKFTRAFQTKLMSLMHQGALLGHKRMDMFEKMSLQFIEKAVHDPEVRKKLIPNTRFGCKRPLVSDDFYPSFNRANVELIDSAAKTIHEDGIETADGRRLPVDVIIYCTGYEVLDYGRIEVIGEDGRTLGEAMAESPEAYKGVLTPGFPNYFFGVGPNATVLSVTYFASAEANVECIVRIIKGMQEKNAKAVRVKASLHRKYNDWLKSRFGDFAWGHSSCTSYYSTPSGATPFLYPGTYQEFRKQQADCTVDDFELV